MWKRLFLVVVFVSLLSMCGSWPFEKDGIVNPKSYYQRFRRPEYPSDKPFFQWWYFFLGDFEANRYVAITLAYSESSNTTTSGSYVMATITDKSKGLKYIKYEKHDIKDFVVEGDFNITIGDCRIRVLDDDTYVLEGSLSSKDPWWWDCSDECPFDETTVVSWNVTLHRNYGWFGQEDLQFPSEVEPVIMWNTYAHDSFIKEAHVKFGNVDVEFDGDVSRGYGDQNWGMRFPSPPEGEGSDLSYSWGWYRALWNISDAGDKALISGCGKTYTGFPMYAMDATFSDIHFGPGDDRVGLRQVHAWDDSKFRHTVLSTTNDGEVVEMSIARSDWVTYKDRFGATPLPLRQTIKLETTNTMVVADYVSVDKDYNRLIFPFQNTVFSDLEGLGVTVHLNVSRKSDEGKWTLVESVTVENGGVEFGHVV